MKAQTRHVTFFMNQPCSLSVCEVQDTQFKMCKGLKEAVCLWIAISSRMAHPRLMLLVLG